MNKEERSINSTTTILQGICLIILGILLIIGRNSFVLLMAYAVALILIMMGIINSIKNIISKENKVGINYFELSFDSEDNQTTFFNTLGLTLDQEIPVVVIIQNKKVTDKLEGVVSKTEVLEFLKSNKIVK